MKKAFGYGLRLIFYTCMVGLSIFSCLVSSGLKERMLLIDQGYIRVYDGIYKGSGYDTLSEKMKDDISFLKNKISVNVSVVEDVEQSCIAIAILISLVAITMFIMDTLKFLKER